MRAPALPLAFALAACTVSDDPADGGFYSGIAGLAGGGYEARQAEARTEVAAAEAEGAALADELARLTAEHAALKDRLIAERAALRAEGVRLTPAAEARVQAALLAEPTGSDPATRAASLRRAIADARALADDLTALAG